MIASDLTPCFFDPRSENIAPGFSSANDLIIIDDPRLAIGATGTGATGTKVRYDPCVPGGHDLRVKVLDGSTITRTRLGQARIVVEAPSSEATRFKSNFAVTDVFQLSVSGWKIAYEQIVFWPGHGPDGGVCEVMNPHR